ncbi:MAG TPA: hypothetical protein DCG49_09675 [Ruminococcus sp.]|nr:hypothetical protein [Ruminococcus sp.]
MLKKVIVPILLIVIVMLMIFVLSMLKNKSDNTAESSVTEPTETHIEVVPSQMPSGITIQVPPGFTETASAYYDKYYVKDDASVIVTGEELANYNENTASYTEQVKAQYAATADEYELLSEKTFENSDTTVSQLVFTYSIVGENKTAHMKCMTAIAVKDCFVYIITCKSSADTFGKYDMQFDSMIHSISIADRGAETLPTGTEDPAAAQTTAVLSGTNAADTAA